MENTSREADQGSLIEHQKLLDVARKRGAEIRDLSTKLKSTESFLRSVITELKKQECFYEVINTAYINTGFDFVKFSSPINLDNTKQNQRNE
tara:strand:- start:1009 stop:1284 length:276 start_codon:yes stop_codon:yes gene_type:complete